MKTGWTKVLRNMVNDSNRLFQKKILQRLHHRNLMTLHVHKYQPAACSFLSPTCGGPSHLLPERDTAVAVSRCWVLRRLLNLPWTARYRARGLYCYRKMTLPESGAVMGFQQWNQVTLHCFDGVSKRGGLNMSHVCEVWARSVEKALNATIYFGEY